MYNCIRSLGLDPFKTYSESDIDNIRSELFEKYKERVGKAATDIDAARAKVALDMLDPSIKEAKKPESFENARNEVLSLIKSNLQNKVFYNQSGEALIFEHMADEIIRPAVNDGWNIDVGAIRSIDGYKVIKKEDYVNRDEQNAEKALIAIGNRSIIEWFNDSIRGLYIEEETRKKLTVTESSSFETLVDTFKILNKRCSLVKDKIVFKKAACEFDFVSSPVSICLRDESRYAVFKQESILYGAEKKIEHAYRQGSPIDRQFVMRVLYITIEDKDLDLNDSMDRLERYCLSKGIVADFSGVEKRYITCEYCGCRFILTAESPTCPKCQNRLNVNIDVQKSRSGGSKGLTIDRLLKKKA